MCRFVRYTGVLNISAVQVFEDTLRRLCTCACVCAFCSFALGDEGGGVQLAYAGGRDLLPARVLFLTEKELGCCLYFFYF